MSKTRKNGKKSGYYQAKDRYMETGCFCNGFFERLDRHSITVQKMVQRFVSQPFCRSDAQLLFKYHVLTCSRQISSTKAIGTENISSPSYFPSPGTSCNECNVTLGILTFHHLQNYQHWCLVQRDPVEVFATGPRTCSH